MTRALSGVRIRDGEQLRISANSAVGRVVVTYRMRYANEGFESPVPSRAKGGDPWPGQLYARGRQRVLVDRELVPSLAVVTNAPIDDLDVHIAFDATPGKGEHQFFENFQRDESGRPRHGRSAP